MKVAIPQKFFLTEALSEYSNPASRLIAELIQNSVDAGSTEVHLDFGETGYRCRDNGCGMSRERLVTAMLTLGGSDKPRGATGGFGAAKKLILFAHRNFRIHSLDTCAVGAVLDYEFEEYGYLSGTDISVNYFEEFPHGDMEYHAVNFLSQCNFMGRCRVFINHVEFTNWTQWGELFNSEPEWDVYSKDGKSCWINVYHNGMFMFNSYVGELKKTIRVNVKIPSKQAFSQNRDSFRAEVKTKFEALCADIIANPKTSLKKFPQKKIWKGKNRFLDHISKKAEGVFTIDQLNRVMTIAAQCNITDEYLPFDALVTALTVEDPDLANILVEHRNEFGQSLNYDFHIRSFGPIDETRYSPLTGLKKYRFLASLYKCCLFEVMKIMEEDISFSIGFIFEDDTEAMFERQNGNSVFYINPKEDLTEGDIKRRFFDVLMAAIHEFCHVHYRGHNEEYAAYLTKTTSKVLYQMRGYTEIIKEARENEDGL